jgi:hypothetical protein
MIIGKTKPRCNLQNLITEDLKEIFPNRLYTTIQNFQKLPFYLKIHDAKLTINSLFLIISVVFISIVAIISIVNNTNEYH